MRFPRSRSVRDLLKHTVCCLLIGSAAFWVGAYLILKPGVFAAAVVPAVFLVIVAGYLFGSTFMNSLPVCRHSRRAIVDRILNTLNMHRFVFTIEEGLFSLAVGFSSSIVVLIAQNRIQNRFDESIPLLFLLGSIGIILGGRDDSNTCTLCNDHQSPDTWFKFKPLSNPDHPYVLERCRTAARRTADSIVRWMGDPENEGGIIVLDGGVGSGKSTYKNLVLHSIAKNHPKVITIEIAAWETLGEKELQQRVLSEIISGLDNHYALGSYRHNWSGMLDSLSKSTPRLSPLLWLANKISVEDYLSEWRSLFLGLRHKVIVVIEDLERFSAKELFALLRLIDELRQFPNLTFFLPADTVECRTILYEARESGIPLDWDSVFDRTFSGRSIQVFAPTPEERLDMLIARFRKDADRWLAGFQ